MSTSGGRRSTAAIWFQEKSDKGRMKEKESCMYLFEDFAEVETERDILLFFILTHHNLYKPERCGG
jgi:hypothetical protein